MIVGSALSLCETAKKSALGLPVWLLFVVATFVIVGILKVPMIWALPLLAVPAIYCAFVFLKRRRRLESRRESEP
jgi:chromate transporter